MAKTKPTWGEGGPPYKVDIRHMSFGEQTIRLTTRAELRLLLLGHEGYIEEYSKTGSWYYVGDGTGVPKDTGEGPVGFPEPTYSEAEYQKVRRFRDRLTRMLRDPQKWDQEQKKKRVKRRLDRIPIIKFKD
jgi:hypothetical protein